MAWTSSQRVTNHIWSAGIHATGSSSRRRAKMGSGSRLEFFGGDGGSEAHRQAAAPARVNSRWRSPGERRGPVLPLGAPRPAGPSDVLGVRAETGVVPTGGSCAAAALRAAVPTWRSAFPGLPGRLTCWGYGPRRKSSQRVAPAPPRPCGPLCRPEVGVPGPAGPFGLLGVRAETGIIPTGGSCAAAALRADVPT